MALANFSFNLVWSFLLSRHLKVYAPTAEQPKLGRTVNELSEKEKPIFELFSQEQFVEKLIKFLTLEENKGKDRFHHKHFTLFKVHICCLHR